MKRILFITILSFCFFQIFGVMVFSQTPSVQRKGIDYFDYSFGVEAWFQANQQMDYADSDVNDDTFNKEPGDFGWQGDDNLFGPIGEVRIVNTGTIMDRFSLSARAMFGKFDVFDSYGYTLFAAPYFDLQVKYTDVMVRGKFSFLPQSQYLQVGCYAAYHYRKYKFSQVKPSIFPGLDEEEMYGGGVGVDSSVLLGKSGVFVYGNGEWLPYIEFMNNDENGWGYTLNGGLGYSLSGGTYLPITVTFLAGYRFHKLEGDDYFDETVESATGGIVVSW
jgi:hypothetical protein